MLNQQIMKIFSLLVFLLFCLGVFSQDVRIYMAATGSTDGNDGDSKSSPIRTLARAIVMVKRELARAVKPKRIFIEIAPGTYYHKPVSWPEDATDNDVEIIFAPATPAAGTRPIFDGCTSSTVNNFLLLFSIIMNLFNSVVL